VSNTLSAKLSTLLNLLQILFELLDQRLPILQLTSGDPQIFYFSFLFLALEQKGPLFNCLTAIGVMLERSEASQWGGYWF
jgi:hypothetical protein